jgi:nucleoside-triphosphatase
VLVRETTEEMTSQDRRRLWLITGEPGAGKSTAVSKVLLRVKAEGFTVGGLLTREIRSHGEREGFTLTDVSTEESEVLASVKGYIGPRVGKYHVNLKSLSGLAVKALEHAKKRSDLIVCDEIGPMELLSPEFRKAVSDCIVKPIDKPTICVVHKRLMDPLIDDLKSLEGAELVEIDFENRNILPGEVADQVVDCLKRGHQQKSGGK